MVDAPVAAKRKTGRSPAADVIALSIYFPTEDYRKLDKQAHVLRRSKSWVVREALAMYLKAEGV